VYVQDDETTKRKILEEDLERSGQFLRDFMHRHRTALSEIGGDRFIEEPTKLDPASVAE
jgi:hypothetical protein